MDTLISIIVPVYNTASYLAQCLDSLVSQTYKNIEIICVNDGSSDNSLEILETYAQKDPRVKVFSQENQGLSGTRNVAFKLASGNYIMYVDSDDWVDTDMCEKMLYAVEEYGAQSCMCCYVKEFENKTTVTNIFDADCVFEGESFKNDFFSRLAGVDDDELSHPERSDVIVSACMQLYKREIIEGHDFVSTKKIGTEDWLFQLEVYAKCDKVVYINRPFYHYRKTNASSLTSNYKSDLFEKWTTLYQMTEQVLKENELFDQYKHVLENKKALTLLFLGLNEIKSSNGIAAQAKRIKEIRGSEQYNDSIAALNISYMPIHWKTFFWLCKKNCMLIVVLMLKAIEFLRKH